MAAACAWIGLLLAMIGPGVIALLWNRVTPPQPSLGESAPWLVAFAFLTAAVAAIAFGCERLTWSDLGWGEISWTSLLYAVVLTLFFIFVFGPLAVRALAKTKLGTFDAGQNKVAALPTWYLCLTIVIVAGGEEWLYRAYALERLYAMIGSIWLAGAVSLLAFAVVHLPVWGIGVSLTTLVSGGIFTAVYIWRRDISCLILAHIVTDLYGLLVAPRRARNVASATSVRERD